MNIKNNISESPNQLFDDEEYVLNLLSKDTTCIPHISERLKKDKNFIIKSIQSNPKQINLLVPLLINDLGVAFAAVNSKYWAISYFSDEIKSHHKIATTVLRKNGLSLSFFPESIKSSPYFIKIALNQNGDAYQFLSLKDKNNPQYIKLALSNNGQTLHHLSNKNKNNKKYVLIALKQNPKSIIFASTQIQKICENSDPIKTLERIIAYQKIQNELNLIDINKIKNKTKI